jgi:hypothetical protein
VANEPVLVKAVEPPAWRIVSTTAPTNIPTHDVQRVTVKATAGELYFIAGANFFGPVSVNLSSAELQGQLEAVLGAGNVEVTGGPGDAGGTNPYVVTFTGALEGQEVELAVFALLPNPATESVEVTPVTKPGGTLELTAINVGADTDGSTVTVNDVLPSKLAGTTASGYEKYLAGGVSSEGKGEHAIPCTSTPPTFTCTFTGVMATGDALHVKVPVSVQPGGSPSAVNAASVSGGNAEHPVSISAPVTLSDTPAVFGVAPGSTVVATSTRQAGAHPNVTTSFTMSTLRSEVPSGSLKDVRADLPPGLVGNTVGMPRCAAAKVFLAECPRDTIVGIATVNIGTLGIFDTPVYNIAPSPGEPAAFLFSAIIIPVRLDTSVLSDGDYAVRVTAANLSEAAPILSTSVTIWGVPADHQGPGPINVFTFENNPGALGGPSTGATRIPLLTNPTQCSSPLTGRVEVDEWGAQGVFSGESSPMGWLTGCGRLDSSGSMSMLPDTLEAGSPAGYAFGLHVPQGNDPDALSQSTVKRVVTALPMGTVISPSAAWGLQACSEEQFYGPAAERGLERPALPGGCPRESQVGTLEIRTPALALPLTGDVYLAKPDCGPCSPEDAQDGRMVRLYAQVVGEGESGIVVKLEGRASVNQQTGQVTATFDNDPPLPFSDLKLTLGGGSRATLANPRVCGPVSTSLDLTPWTNPFTTDFTALSAFEINQGCIAPQFNPSFVAGTTNIQAGEYSPFTLSFGRSDRDQILNGLQMQLPPGMLGSLANVPLCKEPQAAEGTCSEQSLIGHTQVLTGPGGTPFLVSGGKVFLTESYKGAPFGLSIVVPAVAGPYTLSGTTGHGTVVVRAAINIDPHRVTLTVTSDPLPTILDGIPLQLKAVNVTIDRPQFTLNPTSCAKMGITGRLTSKESPGVAISSPFQVTNCAGLGFKPQFKVSTSGHTSRANGASLDAKVIYPRGPKLANVAKVKVSLPKQLPSRLTTLQKACPAATFEANPGSCPRDSMVGIARASTPILPVGLTGPAYFVSHGGEAFPNLIVVLQGYGVRVDLVGDTFISKAGITSSTFNQVPDVPISSFELYLPEGPFSALAANGNLCKSNLTMPTMFAGQNGMVLKQSTKIAVTGCGKAKTARNARKARRASRARRSSRSATIKTGHGQGRKS